MGRRRIDTADHLGTLIPRLLRQSRDEIVDLGEATTGLRDEAGRLVEERRLLTKQHHAPCSGVQCSVVQIEQFVYRTVRVVAYHRQHRDKARHRIGGGESLSDLESDRWHETILRHGLTDCYGCRPKPP